MEEILLFSTILAPIVLAVVEGVKRSVNIKKNYLPLIAVIAGLLIGLASGTFTDLHWDVRLWAGAISGFSAVGLWETVQKREGTTGKD